MGELSTPPEEYPFENATNANRQLEGEWQRAGGGVAEGWWGNGRGLVGAGLSPSSKLISPGIH